MWNELIPIWNELIPARPHITKIEGLTYLTAQVYILPNKSRGGERIRLLWEFCEKIREKYPKNGNSDLENLKNF